MADRKEVERVLSNVDKIKDMPYFGDVGSVEERFIAMELARRFSNIIYWTRCDVDGHFLSAVDEWSDKWLK